MREETILIDFPEEITVPEEEESKEQKADEASVSERNTRTNRASNKTLSPNKAKASDRFFDEDYRKEVEAAQKLSEAVNKQLSKEVVDFEDLKMPVETTEGMDRDSIKNVIYSGESNIVYYLENRFHLRMPVPVYLAQRGGTVVVSIQVDRDGRVRSAKVQNAGVARKELEELALKAARNTLFNVDPKAPALQSGTIHYTFVAQ